MDFDWRQAETQIDLVNALDSPEVRQMLHVPSYQTIDPVQNTNRGVDGIVRVANRNHTLSHINGSQSALFARDGKHVARHRTEGLDKLVSQGLWRCLKFLQNQR